VSTLGAKADSVAELLDGRTVGCAESCTAGRITEVLAAVEFASEWFRGGLVAYQLEVKRRRLGVPAKSMYSEQCAAEMAIGAARLFDCDIVVASTGVLGDEPQDGVAPGTIFIGTFVDGDITTSQHQLSELGVEAIGEAAGLGLDDLFQHLRLTNCSRVAASPPTA